MLIARAPVRISFAGGGTDLRPYFEQFGGLVVSTTIDKYFYVFVSLSDGDAVQIASSDYRGFFREPGASPWSDEMQLRDDDMRLPRAFLRFFGLDSGLSLFLASEIPPGTGLGSSGSVAVALAKAFSTLHRQNPSRSELAETAAHVEIDILGMPIGLQDQYAAAFGGLNVFRFHSDGVVVEPFDLNSDITHELEQRTLLFFTGSSRRAADILHRQWNAVREGRREVVDSLHMIKKGADATIQLLRDGDLDGYAAQLDRSWEAKKALADGISTSEIDRWYANARKAGAAGGKIVGAGGGGFLMLQCEQEYQAGVTATLEADGLVPVDFRFDVGGATVLMNALALPRKTTSVPEDRR